jgi:hypothetical protein
LTSGELIGGAKECQVWTWIVFLFYPSLFRV